MIGGRGGIDNVIYNRVRRRLSHVIGKIHLLTAPSAYIRFLPSSSSFTLSRRTPN